MSKERVKELLQQLHRELADADADAETVALARQLDADIHALLASPAPAGALIDRRRKLEVEFSVDHPVAERIVREIVDALARMGI